MENLKIDGRVIIYHTDQEIIEKTKEMILNVVREVEEDRIYTGKVTVENSNCLVE